MTLMCRMEKIRALHSKCDTAGGSWHSAAQGPEQQGCKVTGFDLFLIAERDDFLSHLIVLTAADPEESCSYELAQAWPAAASRSSRC